MKRTCGLVAGLVLLLAIGLTGCFGNTEVPSGGDATPSESVPATTVATRGEKDVFPVDITVAVSSLKVRSGAGQTFDEIGGARKGDTFTAIGREGDWFKIQFTEATIGYLNAQYVEMQDK